MLTIDNVLGKGYFPRELPPPFETQAFSNWISANISNLPLSLVNNRNLTQICKHNISRVGILKRTLSIPNPITYYKLCIELVNNWMPIYTHTKISRLSRSRPEIVIASNRAIIPWASLAVFPLLRSYMRSSSKYILKTDITQFYHSIYTHSIPWALHTKPIAKANRSSSLLGNRLDLLIRNCQDGQTIGIPIGPDSSLVFAEIILASVDEIVQRVLPSYRGVRYIDDYELCFNSLSDAELALNEIDKALSKFELSLNPKKTMIKELPDFLEDPWVIELNRFDIRPTPRAQQFDLINYFSRAFELVKLYPESYVLRYAVARLRSVVISQSTWTLLQSLLSQCIINEQGIIQYVLELLIRYTNQGFQINTNTFTTTFDKHIQYHAPLGNHGEVAWAVWGALAFNITLDTNTASSISEMEVDSIVALLSLHAFQLNLLPSLDVNNWFQYMTSDALYEEQWLLSYEANVKGWLPSQGRDHVLNDPIFSHLKSNGISFYNVNNIGRIIPNATSPIPGGNFSI